MAQRRSLHKSISQSEKVNPGLATALGLPLVEFGRLLFTWLVPHADDWGRFPADPWHIKLMVMPGSRRGVNAFAKALEAMHDVGLITLYATDKGRPCLQIEQWDAMQQGLHKRTASKYPPAPKVVTRKDLGRLPGTSRNPGARTLTRSRNGSRSKRDSLTESTVSDMAFSECVASAAKALTSERVAGRMLLNIPENVKRRLGPFDPKIANGSNQPLYQGWLRWLSRLREDRRDVATSIILACVTQTVEDAGSKRRNGKPVIKTTVGGYFYKMVQARLAVPGFELPEVTKKKGQANAPRADQATV